jgi:hypothetical protein
MRKARKMKVLIGAAVFVMALVIATSASAACEYCAGPGGNRYCKAATSSGNDDCHAVYGQCTYRGNSCTASTGCTNPYGACEENQSSLPDLILPVLPDGSTFQLEPKVLCESPEYVIES